MSALTIGGYVGLLQSGALAGLDWQAIGQGAMGATLLPVAALLLAVLRPWAHTIGDGSAD